MRLDGRIAVVTGAARGNGGAIAERLAREGAHVLCGDIDEAGARTRAEAITAAGGSAEGVRCDVTDEDEVNELIAVAARAGGPHALVAQAGLAFAKPLEETTLEEWERLLGVDLTGTFLCVRAAIPYMRELGGGSIVTMAGVFAFSAEPMTAVVSAMKGAVVSFTRAVAVEHGEHGIRCNVLVPAYVETDMLRRLFAEQPRGAEALEEIANRHALGRMARPEEVAAVAAFLCSDDASFCTGQPYFVDGGMASGLSALTRPIARAG